MRKSKMPTISVIIPISSESKDLPVLSSLKTVDYPEDKLEIILSIGGNPSVQRNQAAKIANGDIVYFFNRDAQVEPDIFKKATDAINSGEKIAGVGGPDLTPIGNNYIQHLFGYAMGSYFAHWMMRARYSKIGRERFTDEKELLLSNMAIKRNVFLRSNGFNEKLYPNEENELINRILKKGYKFIYNPDIKIYRDRRRTLFTFARQFYKYGQGRMNQVLIEGVLKNLQFFIPSLLLIYFLVLPFIGSFKIAFIPLFMYICLGLIDAVYASFKNKRNLVLMLPPLYIIIHLSYGIGMLSALAWRFKKMDNRKTLLAQEVKIKRIVLR